MSSQPYPIVAERVAQKQELFLQAFKELGTIGKGAEVVGINRESVSIWRRDPAFLERFQQAQAAWADHLEDLVNQRIEHPEGNRGSDILLIAANTAANPQKWNRNIQVTHEVPNELLKQLAELQREYRQAQLPINSNSEEQPTIVEGKAKVRPWD